MKKRVLKFAVTVEILDEKESLDDRTLECIHMDLILEAQAPLDSHIQRVLAPYNWEGTYNVTVEPIIPLSMEPTDETKPPVPVFNPAPSRADVLREITNNPDPRD
jgi:hypothetical protein